MDSQASSIPASASVLVPSSKFGAPAPPRRSLVRRRLLDELDENHWRVALVTAGAATGKTMLVASWYDTLSTESREWLTLDSQDNRPDRFWLAFVMALERSSPGSFTGSLERAVEFDRLQFELLDTVLAEWSSADVPITIVLDDAHHLLDRQIGQDLGALADRLPPESQVVVIGRLDLPFPLHSWRLRSWSIELRQHDLAMTLPEAHGLFDLLDEVRLGSTEVETLWHQSEGWVGALRLASSSLRSRTDLPSAVAEFSGRDPMVADLLIEELLVQQSPETADFLMRTSVVDRLDGELCDALSGRNDSHSILLRMTSELQFVTAIGADRQTFRYHPLLAQLLRFELERQKPGEVKHLHLLAATVLEKRGDYAGAVHHLLAAGEADRAFSLVFVAAFWQNDIGEFATVEAMASLFPKELIEHSTFRMLTYALTLGICGRVSEGLPWLLRAGVRHAEDPAPSRRDQATLEAIQLMAFTLLGELDDQLEAGRRAVEAVDAGIDLGVVGGRTRMNLVRAYLLRDEVDQAEIELHAGDPGDEIAHLIFVPALGARIAHRKGALSEAERNVELAFRSASAIGLDRAHFGVIDAHLPKVGALLDRNRLVEASEALVQLEALMERLDHARPYRMLVDLTRVQLAAAYLHFDRVFSILRQISKYLEPVPPSPLHQRLREAQVRWLLASGERAQAEALIVGLSAEGAIGALLHARFELLQENPGAASKRINSTHFTCNRDQLEATLLLGAIAEASGQEASEFIREAVALAAPECLARPILDAGLSMTRAVRSQAALLGTTEGDNLAGVLGWVQERPTTETKSVIPLTPRELQILRYLPSHLSSAEIAAECFVSVNTIKTHRRSLYQKLNVTSQSGAVDRARILGLI